MVNNIIGTLSIAKISLECNTMDSIENHYTIGSTHSNGFQEYKEKILVRFFILHQRLIMNFLDTKILLPLSNHFDNKEICTKWNKPNN